MRTTGFWNNLHQVRSKSKDLKAISYPCLPNIENK